MKLDQESKFAWQQHTHEQGDVPSIDKLLKFKFRTLHLEEHRAQSSRNKERKQDEDVLSGNNRAKMCGM